MIRIKNPIRLNKNQLWTNTDRYYNGKKNQIFFLMIYTEYLEKKRGKNKRSNEKDFFEKKNFISLIHLIK